MSDDPARIDAQPRPAHPEHLSKGPAGAVTDEMINTALNAYLFEMHSLSGDRADAMRAALEAALGSAAPR